jgi:hypothetical protein
LNAWQAIHVGLASPRRSIHTEISPRRYASVEMTKGRTALPERVVAEWKPFVPPKVMEAPSSLCHLDRSVASWRDLCVDAPSWKRKSKLMVKTAA